MRRISPVLRRAVVLVLALLPVFQWLSTSTVLPQLWLPLLVSAFYGWVCAALAARPEPRAAGPTGDVQAEPFVAPPEGPAALLTSPSDSAAEQAGAAAPTTVVADEFPVPSALPVVPVRDGGPASPEPEPARDTTALPEPADFRVGNAEVRGATDEIARRVVGTSGLLDACSKAAADATADIDALCDEDRHAHKWLAVLRSRTLQLDQRCHALANAAQQPADSADGAERLRKQAQAVEMLVLHIHQLAERLGAAGRAHGARLESLRRSVERVDGYAERGLRESQQVMQLTRRIFQTLDAAEQDLRRVERGGDAASG